MHGNQWVLKIAVLKYYSVSKRGTTAKSNPKQATDPISLHTKFGDNSSNTFPLNERKPCVTPDIGRRTPDIGHRTSDNGHRTSDIGRRKKGDNNLEGFSPSFSHVARERTFEASCSIAPSYYLIHLYWLHHMLLQVVRSLFLNYSLSWYFLF